MVRVMFLARSMSNVLETEFAEGPANGSLPPGRPLILDPAFLAERFAAKDAEQAVISRDRRSLQSVSPERRWGTAQRLSVWPGSDSCKKNFLECFSCQTFGKQTS